MKKQKLTAVCTHCKKELPVSKMVTWDFSVNPNYIECVNCMMEYSQFNRIAMEALIGTSEGVKKVNIKLSVKAQKELDDLKKELNLPEIADKIRV